MGAVSARDLFKRQACSEPIGEVDTILSAITGWIEGLHN